MTKRVIIAYGLRWDVTPDAGEFFIQGPLCEVCLCSLKPLPAVIMDGPCFTCPEGHPGVSKPTIAVKTLEELRALVVEKCKADKRAELPIVSLDLPDTRVKAEDSDEDFRVKVSIGQKKGKRVAVIYIAERKPKDARKAQFFVDLDDGQVRFDSTDKNPGELLVAFTAEFRDLVAQTEYKE